MPNTGDEAASASTTTSSGDIVLAALATPDTISFSSSSLPENKTSRLSVK